MLPQQHSIGPAGSAAASAPPSAVTKLPVASAPDVSLSQSSSSQAAPAAGVSGQDPPQGQQLQPPLIVSHPNHVVHMQPNMPVSFQRPSTSAPHPSATLQHPAPSIRPPPPKKEKTICLFCTKPARSTCQFKLCKKCCNERHPNDCRAHDSGPASNFAKPGDKSKQLKPQPMPAMAVRPDISLSVSQSMGHHPATTPGPPELTLVAPGPDAFDLTSTVAVFQQEKAELIQSQTAVQQRREQQRQEAASEACQRYLVNGHLLAGLCKDADDSELADQEASAARLRRLKLMGSGCPQDAIPQGSSGNATGAGEAGTAADETGTASAELLGIAASIFSEIPVHRTPEFHQGQAVGLLANGVSRYIAA